MGLWSDIISAVGNVFGGGNNSAPDQNNPLKKQQNNTSLPTTNLVSQKINMPTPLRAAPIPIAPTPPINLPITAATIPLVAPNPLNTQIQPAHPLVGAQSPIGVDPIGNIAQSVIKGVVGIPKAVGDTANEAYQLHVANNPTAALNAGKSAMSDLGQTGNLAKTAIADPLGELANTILHPGTQNTYQPTGQISTDIFGNNGIENVNKNVAHNFDASKGNLAHRISSAALDLIGQGAKIASVVAPVIKGAGAVGDVVHGDAPAFSLSPSNVTNATKVALANNAVEGAKTLPTADETAPTIPENTLPPESGTKAPTEPTPTNAPASETTEPTTAPGATESGIKPVETTPVAPTTTEKVNALPTTETPPVTPEATPTPAPVAAEQAAVQNAVDKTAANIPAPVAPPATATADITPEQAAAEVAAQKQVTEEAPSVTFKKTDNPLKTDKPVNPYGIEEVPGQSDEYAAKGHTEGKLPDRAKVLSPKAQLTRSGQAGRQLEQVFRNQEFNTGRLTQAMNNESPKFEALSPKDQDLASDVVRGSKTTDRADINEAADELKSHFKNVLQSRNAAGVEGGDLGEHYIPQMMKADYLENAANRAQMARDLVKEGKAPDNAAATKMVNNLRTTIRSRPNISGHLELPREFEHPMPFHTDELRSYNAEAAKRISEAQHYGVNNEKLDVLITKAANNGEDINSLKQITEDYMHPKPVDKGPTSKVAGGVRGATNVALLPKAALSHAFQGLANTASDVGFGNYFKALAKTAFSSDEKDFIDESGIGTNSPQKSSVLDKITAPGLKPLLSIWQKAAVVGGKYNALDLAAKGDETGLRDIGVTGDLTKGADGKIPLTRTQELQAGVAESNKSIFSHSSLETSKALKGNVGKAIGQLRTAYTAKQGGRIVDLIKDARPVALGGKGNVAPLIRYLTVGAPVAGVGTLALKNLYTKGNPNPFPKGTSKTSDVLNAAQNSGVESLGFGGVESAINAARYNYNNNDRVNNAAGAVSPIAGIATEAGQNIDQALRGNDKPLIKQGASYVPLPVVPGKIDQRFAPTKAITPEEQNYFNKQGPAYTKMTNIINPFNKSATNQNTKTTAIITSLIKSDHNAQGQSIELTPAETQNKWTTISALPPKAQNAYIEYNKSLPDHSPAYDLTGNGTIIGIDGQPSTASKFQIYATYEKDLPGSAERSQLEANNPWLTQTFAAEQALYNSNSYKSNSVPSNDPLPGGVTQKDLTYPTISPATNNLMTQATQLSSILPADRTPEQETQLQTIENNPDLQAAYSSLDNYTNAQRVARGAPPLKLSPNASPAVQAGINAYDALPASKSGGNTDPATSGERSAWILANPALYAQMSNYYASSDMATIASQGAKDELQGNAPSQSLLGAIKSAGTNDIASSKNANGTTSYSIDPAAAYAQSGSSGSSYTSPSTLAYDRDKAAGFSDSMRIKSAVNIKSVNGLKAGTDKYKEPKLIANKAPTGKNGNPFVQSITDTKGVTSGKGSNIFGHAISHVKSVKAA